MQISGKGLCGQSIQQQHLGINIGDEMKQCKIIFSGELAAIEPALGLPT